jgi:hypothetical protein
MNSSGNNDDAPYVDDVADNYVEVMCQVRRRLSSDIEFKCQLML